jgi:DNA-binding Lrp family transcriptional regulator
VVRPRTTGRAGAAALLDDVGKAVLRQLQEDGRRSCTAIGEAVGLSEAAVRQRVKGLTELVCRDDERLVSVIDDRIRPMPGVDETETSICLRVHEQTCNDGTP